MDSFFFGKITCRTHRRVILEALFAVDFACGGAYPVGCWGVVQSVGHLTVNEDGGGSNPPAPANFLQSVEQQQEVNQRQEEIAAVHAEVRGVLGDHNWSTDRKPPREILQASQV